MAHLLRSASNLIFEVLRRSQQCFPLSKSEFQFQHDTWNLLGIWFEHDGKKGVFGTTRGIRPNWKEFPVFSISNTGCFHQLLPVNAGTFFFLGCPLKNCLKWQSVRFSLRRNSCVKKVFWSWVSWNWINRKLTRTCRVLRTFRWSAKSESSWTTAIL